MRFIKENSYDAVRLFINQVGITIFSLVIYTAANLIDNSEMSGSLRPWLSVFAILFYFSLIYNVAWEMGAKDKLRLTADELHRSRFKGALVSLIANSPNLLLAALAVISSLVYILGGGEIFNTVFALLNFAMRFLSAMFLGVIQKIFVSVDDVTMRYFYESVGYLVAPVLSIVVTQLGYALGMREFKILSSFSGRK
jgi:type III secretory pathway component EscU